MADINIKDTIAQEKAVGRKYAQQLLHSIKSQLAVLDKQTGKTSRPVSRVRFRFYQLESIGVVTVKSAFINHFGVDKERKSHTFKSKSGKTLIRKAHPFKLDPKVKKLEIPASIVNGLADEISEIRGTEVLIEANKALDIK